MALNRITILIIVLLISFEPFLLSQNGSLTDNYTFIKNRIDTLNFYANQLSQKERERSKIDAEQALFLAEKIHYKKGMAEAYEMLGMYYGGRDEFVKSLKMFFDFLELTKQLRDVNEEIWANLRISAVYIHIHNFEQAKLYLTNAQILLSEGCEADIRGLVHHYFGLYYYEMRDVSSALNSTITAFEYFREAGNKEMLARSEKLLGDIYIELGKFDESVEAYERAMALFTLSNFPSEEGILLTRIAHVNSLKGNQREVLKYNYKALRIRESINDSILISHSLINIGKTYMRLDRSDSALYYMSRGLEVALSSGNNYAIQDAYYNLYIYNSRFGNLRASLTNFEHYFDSYHKYSKERTKSEIYSLEIKSQIKDIETQNLLLNQKLDIQTLELKTRSYSELITQLIIGIIGVLLIITVYIIERNKLGKSKLERINEQLNQEIGERKLTEIQLRDSEGKYRFITEHTLDLIVRMDRNFNYLFVSPSILRMFGYSAEDKINLPPLNELIPDKFKDKLKTKYLEMIRTKEPMMLTHQSEHKNGSLFWSESFVNPIFDGNTGKLKETITVIRNVTDRIVYEEALSGNAKQKELLLREIHHRVKNNFAILVSLMNMQKVSTEPGNFKDFLTELQGRIRTMSLVHELLYRSHDLDCINFGEYLSQLVGVISRAYKNKHVEIHSTFDNCILDVETALPLGLISNEIITNAYKYAFTDLPEGELWVELRKYPVENHEKGLYTHTLTIRDNGPGIPGGFSVENQSTMGSQIISLLTEQLEAKLNCSGENGTSFTICFSGEKRL